MIVDTSAMMALMLREPDAGAIKARLSEAASPCMAAATLVELQIVAGNRGGEAILAELDAVLRDFRIAVVPFTAEHAAVAREGWRRFGKGRHPAALNLGDCFSYALAMARGEPLLFKGNDFPRTDVLAAIVPDA